MEKIKLVKEKKEKVREEEYRELIKNTIMRYVRSNKAEDCTRTNLLTYVANDDKVQDARKKRYRSKRSNDDAYQKPANNARYEVMFRIALGELINDDKKLERVKEDGKHPKYVLSPSETQIISLHNAEIAIFQVGEERENEVKNRIKDKIKDENIVVIPVNGFLLCAMKNPCNYNEKESQLEYIREQVENAIEEVYGTVYVEEESEKYE